MTLPGFLVNFISAPVISGFITASAFIILFGQLKTFTGLKFEADTVIDYSISYVNTIGKIKLEHTATMFSSLN